MEGQYELKIFAVEQASRLILSRIPPVIDPSKLPIEIDPVKFAESMKAQSIMWAQTTIPDEVDHLLNVANKIYSWIVTKD